ncbi:MAG: gamma-glutamylcyclotransferase [Gammaproteobacteria bacterium]|nr:gamma-glutamylcyclotransferase [Gammaproteobacteria bacterium]
MSVTVHHYFAYGSNMNPDRVRQRKMSFESADSGQLFDYSLRFNKRSVKYPGAAAANVMAVSKGVTEGVVYRLVDPTQIEMMDPYEGYPVLYNRTALPIVTRAGVVDAWVYIANEDHVTEGLAPARWYLNHLLAGRDYLSVPYFESLCQTRCLHDSDIESV